MKKNTKQFVLTLDLKDDPKLIEEYEYWHRPENAWPEIPEGIKKVGILEMNIFRYKTRLVMIMETKPDFDFERDMERLSQLPRQEEWEDFVSKFQKSVPGVPSGEKWQRMKQIFELP